MASPDPKESFAALFESSQSGDNRPKRYRRGERLDVKVVAIGRDAVFVDLGGKQEGFFDSASVLGSNGKLSVEVGSTVRAIVVEADGERVKLAPVFVRTSEAPSVIDTGSESFAIPRAKSGPLLIEGSHVRGAVTGVERYGVFVQISGTQGRHGRGLVPTAETGTPRGADLRKLFPVGQEVDAKILSIGEDGRIRMSFKAMTADAERGDYEAYAKSRDQPESAESAEGAPAASSDAKKGAPEKKRPPPQPRNFGTLGDLLAKRKL